MNDVLGEAIWDYYQQKPHGKLWIHNKYGKKEEMPVATYFRSASEMPQLELIALQHCTGRILDVGAGAGSHALQLQQEGKDVTAVEISKKAAAVMKLRGIEKIICEDFFSYREGVFDTILLLMNGIGLTGNIQRLQQFLRHAKTLLQPAGNLVFDSSDVSYLYDPVVPEMDHYYGEIRYRYEYKKQKGDWFTWLYIDQETLTDVATKEGWQTTIVFVDEFDQYLAVLRRGNNA